MGDTEASNASTASAPLRVCAACHELVTQSRFSRRQWRAGAISGRCQECMANGRAVTVTPWLDEYINELTRSYTELVTHEELDFWFREGSATAWDEGYRIISVTVFDKKDTICSFSSIGELREYLQRWSTKFKGPDYRYSANADLQQAVDTLGVEEAIAERVAANNGVAIILRAPIFQRIHKGGFAYGGCATRIEFLQRPVGDQLLAVQANHFMHNLGDAVLDHLCTPGMVETSCAALTVSFKQARKAYLQCEICCPTDEEYAAGKKLFHRATCTELRPCGHDSHSDCTTKIIHVDLDFPMCLPSELQSDLSWLGDRSRWQTIVDRIVGERGSLEIGVQSPGDLHTCHGFGPGTEEHTKLSRMLAETPPSDYLATVHIKLSYEKFAPCIQASDTMLPVILSRRQPFIRVHLVGNSSLESGNGAFQLKVEHKICDGCGQEEKVSKTFQTCNACRNAYYCGKKCQKLATASQRVRPHLLTQQPCGGESTRGREQSVGRTTHWIVPVLSSV